MVRNPRFPITPRHLIDSWPRTARPSRRISLCNSSSACPSFCSTRNATWSTSRGFRVGGMSAPSPISQFNDRERKGDLGLSFVCYYNIISAFFNHSIMYRQQQIAWTHLHNNRIITHILQLSLESKTSKSRFPIRRSQSLLIHFHGW